VAKLGASKDNRPLAIFCACAPGLEPILLGEITALGLQGVASPGGVSLQGGPRELLLCNLWLRTAGRVLVRLGTFRATAFPELVKRARELPFETVLGANARSLALKATCRKSRLYHSDAVIERVQLAVEERLSRKFSLEDPASEDDETSIAGDEAADVNEGSALQSPKPRAQLLLVRFDHDECTISADASGALLHRRGYRTQLSRAPLRETLAAGLLLAAGYQGGPLLDPCCGGGTLPIEAALIAQNRAPGGSRAFACETWPGVEKSLSDRVRAEAKSKEKPLTPGLIAGSDLDAKAIVAAQTNSRAAGLVVGSSAPRAAAIEPRPVATDLITFSAKPLEAWKGSELAPGTLVIANPPYGKRVGAPGPEMLALWRSLGALSRAHQGPAALLCPNNDLARAAGPSFRPMVRTQNGGLPVQLLIATAQANAR
jgi:putative N6-adenine-specific DNA methylase